MKSLYSLAIALLATSIFNHNVLAQDYSLVTSTSEYANLKSPLPISDPSKKTITEQYHGKMPFKITVFGREVDFNHEAGFYISRYGFLIDQNQHGIGIGAYFALMVRRDETSSISYKIEGESPNKILKIQWRNMGLKDHSQSDFVNAQLWLHEKDNVISMHMGPNSVTSIAGFKIGDDNNPTQVNGPEIGFYRYDPNSTYWGDKQELIGDPKNPTVVSEAPDQALSSVPEANMVYTFYPPGVSGIGEKEKKSTAQLFQAFPNPSSDFVTLDFKEVKSHKTTIIMDLAGRVVLNESCSACKNSKLDVSKLPNGMYQLRVDADSETEVKKLLIKR